MLQDISPVCRSTHWRQGKENQRHKAFEQFRFETKSYSHRTWRHHRFLTIIPIGICVPLSHHGIYIRRSNLRTRLTFDKPDPPRVNYYRPTKPSADGRRILAEIQQRRQTNKNLKPLVAASAPAPKGNHPHRRTNRFIYDTAVESDGQGGDVPSVPSSPEVSRSLSHLDKSQTTSAFRSMLQTTFRSIPSSASEQNHGRDQAGHQEDSRQIRVPQH